MVVDYGQFCPVAKAAELIGERWTILIIRELVLGTHRFSDFQRALSRVSPSLLSKRLNDLEKAGIVIKKAQHGRKGFEYFLGREGVTDVLAFPLERARAAHRMPRRRCTPAQPPQGQPTDDACGTHAGNGLDTLQELTVESGTGLGVRV